jgi:CMP-N-acetylneuraminic acid synthetase
MLICIIPARGNSKGIPRKNLSIVGKMSLVEYALGLAATCKLIEKIILSTDNLEIAKLLTQHAKNSSVKFDKKENDVLYINEKLSIHRRKAEDAKDNSRTIDGVIDVIKKMSLKPSDQILLLQPTSPFRTTKEIVQLIDSLNSNEEYDSIFSARIFESPHPSKSFQLNSKGSINANSELIKNLGTPRQELPSFYIADGAFYLSSVESILRNQSFVSLKSKIFIRHGLKTINIDTVEDLEFARWVISKHKFDFFEGLYD